MKDKALIWPNHLLKQQKPTLTILRYCDHHHLSAGMFYYWKRKVTSPDIHKQFAEIEIIEQASIRGIIIKLAYRQDLVAFRREMNCSKILISKTL